MEALRTKLRCATWHQLAIIYRRDLSRKAMFLKASTQPPIGTPVKIDLELPSGTVIELIGTIAKHTSDPQRGTGVELTLEPLPTQSVWLIESALAAVKTGPVPRVSDAQSDAKSGLRAITDGEDVAAAEQQLITALEAEADSLRRLNPFLVLGVSYETSDEDIRASFGELTKRYHPDRFARYQSPRLRQLAAEIFILIRDAYRKLADADSRAQMMAQLGVKPPQRTHAVPHGVPVSKPPRVVIPPKTEPLANTELARDGSAVTPVADVRSAPVAMRPDARGASPRVPVPTVPLDVNRSEQADAAALEGLVEDGKLDQALAQYTAQAKKHPRERLFRAGIELCEGLRALAARDRMEAAQRFEAALEIDPSNERAARELAEMRRQATNERKGLLSRLIAKKEPP
jgi:DnaJ-domain-containing protein 1